MGNLITSCGREEPALQLSNGGTTVLLSCLALAGGELAVATWEKKCLAWIATHDQEICGLGCASFDLADLAWSREGFLEQKAFLVRLIDSALSEPVWNRLPYDPPYVGDDLKTLRELVSTIDDFEMAERTELIGKRWWPEDNQLFPQCQRDRSYPSIYDTCLVCNDVDSVRD